MFNIISLHLPQAVPAPVVSATFSKVSAPFLTDVEKDRRNPFDMEKLTQLAQILNLSKEENAQMLDLAGKKRNAVAPDLPEYIMERDYVSAALRTARDLDAGEEEWNQFVEELRKRKG